MRLSSLALWLGAATVGAAAGDDSDSSDTREITFFDGKEVPPMLELTPDTFGQASKASKWMMIKHYR